MLSQPKQTDGSTAASFGKVQEKVKEPAEIVHRTKEAIFCFGLKGKMDRPMYEFFLDKYSFEMIFFFTTGFWCLFLKINQI